MTRGSHFNSIAEYAKMWSNAVNIHIPSNVMIMTLISDIWLKAVRLARLRSSLGSKRYSIVTAKSHAVNKLRINLDIKTPPALRI